jgi:predicted ester cyclase
MGAKERAKMPSEDNVKLVRRLSQFFNERRFDELEGTVFSPALVYRHNGREADLMRWMKDSKECVISFPDAKEVIENVTEDGDRVSITFRFQGTHLGPVGHSEATGRKFDVAGTATYRIMHNLIVEATEQVDEDALAQQLGLK